MKILVTGSNGFIAKNLLVHLKYSSDHEVLVFNKENSISDLKNLIKNTDFIFHLAGVNRPKSEIEYNSNYELTHEIVKVCEEGNFNVPILYSSSSQAEIDNPYGRSKLNAEKILIDYQKKNHVPVFIYRLSNVFGKWSKPNYNSVVSTFCFNIAHDMDIKIDDPESEINLVYIDDVIKSFIEKLIKSSSAELYYYIDQVYKIKLGDLANKIKNFNQHRNTLKISSVGKGLERALYSTFISYLPKNKFSYPLKENIDSRGKFVEILKTDNSGQISFLSTPPGETRGCHFHHTKSEKFVVINGKARIKFRNLLNNESHEICTSDSKTEIVDTIPGWVHDITNIGDKELIVLIWSNEIFDKDNPDTFYEKT